MRHGSPCFVMSKCSVLTFKELSNMNKSCVKWGDIVAETSRVHSRMGWSIRLLKFSLNEMAFLAVNLQVKLLDCKRLCFHQALTSMDLQRKANAYMTVKKEMIVGGIFLSWRKFMLWVCWDTIKINYSKYEWYDQINVQCTLLVTKDPWVCDKHHSPVQIAQQHILVLSDTEKKRKNHTRFNRFN